MTKHRLKPISFDEDTGVAVYACKCGHSEIRKAAFICPEPVPEESAPTARKCFGCDQVKVYDGEFCDECREAWKEEGREGTY